MLYPFENQETSEENTNDIVIEEKLDMIKKQQTQLSIIQNAYTTLKNQEIETEEIIKFNTLELSELEDDYKIELESYKTALQAAEAEKNEEEIKLKKAEKKAEEALKKLELDENAEETLNINTCVEKIKIDTIYDTEQIKYNSNDIQISKLKELLTEAILNQKLLTNKESEIHSINEESNKCKGKVDEQIISLKSYVNDIEKNIEKMKTTCDNDGYYIDYSKFMDNNIWEHEGNQECSTINFNKCKVTHDIETPTISDEEMNSRNKIFDINFILKNNFCPTKLTIDPKWSAEREKLKLNLDTINFNISEIQSNIDILDNKLKYELPQWKGKNIDSLKIQIHDIKLNREKINLDLKLKMDKLKLIQLNIEASRPGCIY